MEKRIGVVSIVVENLESAAKVNAILHEHSHIIVGEWVCPTKKREYQL
jgi:hypothetical protein